MPTWRATAVSRSVWSTPTVSSRAAPRVSAVRLGLDLRANGADLTEAGGVVVLHRREQAVRPPHASGPRVGVSGAGGDGGTHPWRYWLTSESTVSAYRPAYRSPASVDAPRGATTSADATCTPAAAAAARRHHPGDLPVNHILDELAWRGLIAQSTELDALRTALDAGPVSLYCGFDPTAPSLHIGNLVQILTVRRFQDAGHRAFGLVGGATGLIGDPRMTGERTLNEPEVVRGWVDRIQRADRTAPALRRRRTRRTMVNNLDWTASLSAIDFLRDIGKHYRLGTMLAKDTVARRLNSDQGISFTEFSYQILQGMDFLELYRRYGVSLQTGGNDQWGNLLSGVELIRKVEGTTAHAVTTPLITKADGTKFGKTETGTVWLDPQMTSPYAFYQFWLNAEDADVVRYLKVFTFRTQEQIEELAEAVRERPAAREAQRVLAHDSHVVGPRRRCGRQGGGGEPRAVRPRLAERARRPRRSPQPSRSCPARGGPGGPHLRPARRDGCRPQQGGGAAGDRRGRRVGQQRAGRRRGRGARGRGPAARALGGAPPRQAHAGRGRLRGLIGLTGRVPAARSPGTRPSPSVVRAARGTGPARARHGRRQESPGRDLRPPQHPRNVLEFARQGGTDTAGLARVAGPGRRTTPECLVRGALRVSATGAGRAPGGRPIAEMRSAER